MNRRELLKAIIASPFVAAAGASLKAAPVVAPTPVVAAFSPLGDWTVSESLYRPPSCTYRTALSRAPQLGQEVRVERDGEVYFVGTVDRLGIDGESVEVHASGSQPEITEHDYRNIYGINAVNYPGDWPRPR